MKTLIPMLLLLIAAPALAEDDWVLIARVNDGSEWRAQPGSFSYGKRKDDMPLVYMVGKYIDGTTGHVSRARIPARQ